MTREGIYIVHCSPCRGLIEAVAFVEEGSVNDWQPTIMLRMIPVGGRLFAYQVFAECET